MADFPPKMRVVVSAAVRRGDELLFTRHTYGAFRGQWSFPTGYVDPGEQPDAAALREALEEGGVVAEIEGLMAAMTIFTDGEPMLYLVFAARYLSGEPTPDGVEIDCAAFFGQDTLASGAHPIEASNAHFARQVLAGHAQILRPQDSRHWNDDYRTTYA